jgi:hypothetical protein
MRRSSEAMRRTLDLDRRLLQSASWRSDDTPTWMRRSGSVKVVRSAGRVCSPGRRGDSSSRASSRGAPEARERTRAMAKRRMDRRVRLVLHLPADVHRLLRRLAARADTTTAAFVETLLKQRVLDVSPVPHRAGPAAPALLARDTRGRHRRGTGSPAGRLPRALAHGARAQPRIRGGRASRARTHRRGGRGGAAYWPRLVGTPPRA